MSHAHRTAAVLAALLVSALLPPAPAGAEEATPEPYAAEAAVAQDAAPHGSKVKEEWETGCPNLPPSQGQDGFVFMLPERLSSDVWFAEMRSHDAPPVHDVDMYFYDAACKQLAPKENTADLDSVESSEMPVGTSYVLGVAYLGAPYTLSLSISYLRSSSSSSPPPPPPPGGSGQPEPCVLPEHAPAPAASDAWPTTSPAVSYVGGADHAAVAASEVGAMHIGGFYSGMYVSRDGGNAWSRTSTAGNVRAIGFADREHGWAAGDGTTVRMTRDGGVTWSACTFDSQISLVINDIDFVDPLHGWLVGKTYGHERPLIYRTTDGGVTWVAQSPAGISSGVLSSVDFIDRLRGFAVGPTVALSTTDGGATWTRMNLAATDLQAVLVIADGLLAVGFGGVVHHSADFGLSWSERAKVARGAKSLSSAGEAVFVAGMFGLLSASFDGGRTWLAEWARTTHLRDVVAVGPRRAVAVGDDGVVVRVTAQPPAPPAANATYFFTQSGETPTFTSERPQSNEDQVAVDLPGNNATPESAQDPTWHGAVHGTINRIDVDFWQRSGEDALEYGSYELVVWIGAGNDAHRTVRRFWRSTALQTGPTRVTAIFEDLSIDPRGKPVSLSLRDPLVDGTSIVYGSAQHPSGFTINPDAPSAIPACGAVTDVVRQDSATNDPCLASQWGLHQIDAPAAWQHKQATGRDVVAAVIDTGLDLAHPDFACPGKVLELDDADVVGDGGSVQDGHGHGSHVGGIIGACTDNREGVAGVAPNVTLLPIQYFNAAGRSNGNLAQAIDVATDNGAHVINMSLGYRSAVIGAAVMTLTPELQAAIERAAAAGVVLVASAGNSDEPLCGYPAASPDIVCVTAVGPNRQQTWYTNFATKLDGTSTGPSLAAPGGTGDSCENDILSTWIRSAEVFCSTTSGYEAIAGTSMAAPHVAGAAALLYERLGAERSEQNARTIIHALTSTAQDLGEQGWDPVYGSGLLDADAAVLAVPPVAPPLKATTLTITAASDTSGQYSDPAHVEARLTEQNGTPVAGATVHFSLGSGAVASAATDADGVVALDLPLVEQPGDTQLRAHFTGTDAHGESRAEVPFSVQQETTRLLLQNDKKIMHALLHDDDDTAVPNRLIAFYAPDGRHVGSALTASDGIATLNVKCSGRCVSSAVFEPDPYYLGSRSG